MLNNQNLKINKLNKTINKKVDFLICKMLFSNLRKKLILYMNNNSKDNNKNNKCNNISNNHNPQMKAFS